MLCRGAVACARVLRCETSTIAGRSLIYRAVVAFGIAVQEAGPVRKEALSLRRPFRYGGPVHKEALSESLSERLSVRRPCCEFLRVKGLNLT